MTDKERREQRIEAGLCGVCSEPRGEDGTQTLCRLCADKHKERWGAVRDARIAAGLCVRCGEQPASVGQQCTECVERKRRYDRVRAAELKSKGLCAECGNFKALPDNIACEKCYLKQKSRDHLGSVRGWRALRRLWSKQKGVCPYTGLHLTMGIDASIDHIKPKYLYPELAKDLDNLQWVHKTVNEMKGYQTEQEFLALINLICTYQGEK